MSEDKPSTARIILAWITGISMWLLTSGLINSLLLQLGLPYDNFMKYAMVVPCIVVGIRTGMAVRIGEFNGGVSKKGNIQSARWLIFFIMVGSLGTVAQICMNMALDKTIWLKAILISLLVNGLGALLLVKMRLINDDIE